MLKEGLVVGGIDIANFQENRERIAKLLRFASSRSEDPSAMVSLDEYIARMPEEQKKIYYLGGPGLRLDRQEPEPRDLPPPRDRSALPHRPDRRVRHHRRCRIYQGKALTSIDSADLDLPETAETTEAEPKSRGTQGQGERIRPRPRPVPHRARRIGSARSASRSG